MHLLLHPVGAAAAGQVVDERVIDVAQMRYVGDGVRELGVGQRPPRPIGEAVRFVERVPGNALHKLVIGDGVAVAEHHGRADWVQEEMHVLTSADTYRMDPENAWRRLKTRVRKPRELAVLIEVAAWREREAQSRDVPRSRELKDEAIADIAVQAPSTTEKLRNLRSLPKGFERSRWGEAIVEAVSHGLDRDVKSLPRPARLPPSANGTAVVELLKVLLRMISESHHVAAKVIATVDDLERIAADDAADVPALTGWRRELFGVKALALKRGDLALAIERGKVAAVERR